MGGWAGKCTSKRIDPSTGSTRVEDTQQKVHNWNQRKIKSEPDSGGLKSWTEESWQVLEQERSLCFRETYFSSGSQHGLDNRKICSLLGGVGAKHKTPVHRKAFCWALFPWVKHCPYAEGLEEEG